MSIRITGTGSALPGRYVTNEEIAGLVDTSDEWIRERTGIGGRYVSVGETVAELAARACVSALENAEKEAGEVELLLVATCSPEDTTPCIACQVQDKIGAGNAVAFDLNAACAGFLFALHTLNSIITASSEDRRGSRTTSYLPKPLSRLDVILYLSARSTVSPSMKP